MRVQGRYAAAMRNYGLAAAAAALAVTGCGMSVEQVRKNSSSAPATEELGLAASTAAKPNIVVFMIDDLDQRSMDTLISLGYLQNIKKYIMSKGVEFRNSISTDAICCPSRATFFTGQYTHRHGVFDITKGAGYLYPTDASGQGGEATLLPKWLQAAGYRTALFGKYLNGYTQTDGGSVTRVPVGWHKWLGLYGGAGTYAVYGYTYNEDGVAKTGGTATADYQTDFLSTKISQYISGLNAATPQFLYIAPTPPHTTAPELWSTGTILYGTVFSWQIPPPARYENMPVGNASNGGLPNQDQTIPNFNESDVSDKPDWLRNLVPLMGNQTKTWAARQWRQRLASTLAIDDMVGSVAQSLSAKGMLANTIFVFTADNGFFLGEHRLAEKGVPYEEAIRVPLLIGGRGIQPGTRCTNLVGNHDLAVTIADYASAPPPASRVPDGRSLRPWLTSASTHSSRKQILIEHYQENTRAQVFDIIWPYGAMRMPNSLFVDYGSVSGATVTKEFYNLGTDPWQMTNSYNSLSSSAKSSYASKLATLRACSGSSCVAAEDAP